MRAFLSHLQIFICCQILNTEPVELRMAYSEVLDLNRDEDVILSLKMLCVSLLQPSKADFCLNF